MELAAHWQLTQTHAATLIPTRVLRPTRRPQLGLMRSILIGMLIFSSGLSATAFAPTPQLFIASIVLVSVGCVCIPALQAQRRVTSRDG